MLVWPLVAEALAAQGRCVLVTVAAVDGSAPREAGARMIVLPSGGFHGTVGGGTLEWRALAEAQKILETGQAQARWIRQSLGPDLGQCCGGRVTLLLEPLDASSLPQARSFAQLEAGGGFISRGRMVDGRLRREVQAEKSLGPGAGIALTADGGLAECFGDIGRSVLLFGAGHVGRALILALAPLPLRVGSTVPSTLPRSNWGCRPINSSSVIPMRPAIWVSVSFGPTMTRNGWPIIFCALSMSSSG